MKVSIIIPCYKAERYIRECIESIRNQTFTDWEAICVDNASPDTCGAVLDEYSKADARIKVIHRHENVGVWAARNDALDIVKGEYVTFVDADDLIEADWLSEAMKLAERRHFDLIRLAKLGLDDWAFKSVEFEGNDAAAWCWHTLSEYGFLWLCFIRRSCIGSLRFRSTINCKEDGVFLMELIPQLTEICQGEFRGYVYRTFAGSLAKRNRSVAQSTAYLAAYGDIWDAQKDWASRAGIADLIRCRLRQGADHDVWEWFHLRKPNGGDPKEIRKAYLKLEGKGALSQNWCHNRKRLFIPWLIWRMTGSWIGFTFLEGAERMVCELMKIVRGCTK